MESAAQELDLEAFRPSEAEAQLRVTIDPPVTPLRQRLWGAALVVGVVLLVGYGVSPMWAAGLGLPIVFLYAGYRAVVQRPVATVLRFLDAGVEIATVGRGWQSVSWDQVTRLVMDASGGGSLQCGATDVERWTVANLPKAELERLLAASILPAHVEVVQVPQAAPKDSKRQMVKTIALWLALIGIFVLLHFLGVFR